MCTNNIYFTGNKNNYFEIYAYQVLKVCPFSIHFKDLKLPISIKKLFIFAWPLYQFHELPIVIC